MQVLPNVSLKDFTTIRLGGNARFLAEVSSPTEVQMIIKNARTQSLPFFILGGGSNVIAESAGFPGIIIHNKIPGFKVISDGIESTIIKVGAGENWDETVRRTVEMGLSGMAALSAIPGTVGGAPVQNIGAYGQEVADCIQSIEVYDTESDVFLKLSRDDCQFSYRDSIFKGARAGQYVIIEVIFELYKEPLTPPFYKGLQDYFDQNNISTYTPIVVREAVINIRRVKLPDPSQAPNAGSFFKNVIIEQWQLDDLKKEFTDVPVFDMPDGRYKLSTGWLIEQVGLKGQILHGIRVHDKNALVLINESAASSDDLELARDEIITAVRDRFRITIAQEPIVISV